MSTAELSSFVERLVRLAPAADDAERIDRIRLLEELKAVGSAAQAVETVAFADSQRAEQAAAGVRADKIGTGIAAQVGLAKRQSPWHAGRYVGWVTILTAELPSTLALLAAGRTTEWRALVVARETVFLSAEQRATVDGELAARLSDLGDREVERETRRLAYGLDPHGFLGRSRTAARDRRVSLRPAPDVMTRLTAYLPAAAGVAAWAALDRAAKSARAPGDERTRGQVMADTLVERITGQTTVAATPVEISLVMTDQTVFSTRQAAPSADCQTDDAPSATSNSAPTDSAHMPLDFGPNEAAHLVGYGPIPAGVARDLIRSTDAPVWYRRIYLDPPTGGLAAMESRRRVFDGVLQDAMIIRDEICRTPWCGAPIRHGDHVVSRASGGPTSLDNGQGLCEACNYVKEAQGWNARPGPGGAGRSVIITTPTGHTYTSRPPGLPGAARSARAGPHAGAAEPTAA